MRFFFQAVLISAAALLLWAPSAHADIFECRAEDGSVHYTNVRPGGPDGQRCRTLVRQQATPEATASSRPASPSPRRRGNQTRSRDPSRYARFDTFINEAATLYELPVSLIRAVIRVESDYNPGVVSHAGAQGLMQLMPRTANSMGVRDAFDPRQNILGGTRYLRILANLFNGDLVLTIAAYNAGEGAVGRYRGVPPYRETRRYVGRVLRHYYAYASGPQQ